MKHAILIFAFVFSFLEIARPQTSLANGSSAQPAVNTPALQTTAQPAKGTGLVLPLKSGSVRFAVIGDSGTGDLAQYEVAAQMKTFHDQFPFDFVIMLGDNIYGGHTGQDFNRKFEVPYKPLLDQGVKFYASLGNHDDPNQESLYKLFNMNGERYYTFKKGLVEFFVLDSNYMDPKQLDWLSQNLQSSNSQWKISYFHHPLFSNGKHHGPDLDLRARLLPLFRQYGVNVVFSGHEHVYERMKPESNIYFFIVGNSAQLMTHDFHTTNGMDSSLDTDRTFMLVEISGDTLYFQTIARSGKTVDSGALDRQPHPASASVNQ